MERYIDTAKLAAREASKILIENLGSISSEEIEKKQVADFVTRVDRESENRIIEIIKGAFPEHRILAEETGGQSQGDGYLWIIDPLDGTTNYIHSYPMFAISIALQFNGDIIVGVVYDPLRDEMFWAEKGRGAFLHETPLSIAERSVQMQSALIATGFPFRAKHLIDDYLELFKEIFSSCSDLRRAGSAALDLAYVAAGRCDGFFEIGLSPWDVAAGSLLVEEAGGVVTDFRGGSEHVWTGNIVAAHRGIHDDLIKFTRRLAL